MRTYLGPKPPVDYEVARDNTRWSDHVARAHLTAALIASHHPSSVIDPACGDGSIVRLANKLSPIARISLGDISGPNVENVAHVLPAARVVRSDALGLLQRSASHDMVVLTEILEHLENPDLLLEVARAKAGLLVASSPVMRPDQWDDNEEHLWQFSAVGYEAMLKAAGWDVIQWTVAHFPRHTYDFGIWVCQ